MRAVLPLVLSMAFLDCRSSPPPEEKPIRLVDVFQTDWVSGTPPGQDAPPPRTEWRFDGPPRSEGTHAATWGFEAGPGVAALSVAEGRLVGRSNSDFPILRVERESDLEANDQLHAVEIRMRVSAGANLAVQTTSRETVDLVEAQQMARGLPWFMTTPILADGEMRTYTVSPPVSVLTSQIRHVLIRPTDAAGARFEIESVRVISRREHLAEIGSGIGWQGMSEIYRESVVARAPETIRFPARLPSRPTFDLALGTVEPAPLTFRVGIAAGDAPEAAPERWLLARTVTTPYRWEHLHLDLSEHAGESVTLFLSLESDEPGAIGIWGSPTVRQRAREEREAKRPRGIVLLWADTLRKDHLEAYGYERATAPAIARLAEEGAVFERSMSQATWTKVSTPSLLTSLYPSTHGVLDFSQFLPASATTLAEVYREAGYATVSFASNLFTGRFTNLHQGFEELHEDGSLTDSGSSKTSREYVDRLLAWLDRHREVPFFAFVHVYDPHDPYEPREPYDRLWADPSRAEEHERQGAAIREVIEDPLGRLFLMPSREEIARAGLDPEAYVGHVKDWYDGSIRGMDAEIARLLERLEEWGMEDSTLVVFAADHGEEFLEHGRTFHGQSVYAELTNVPLIFRWPERINPGLRIDQTVETIDVMPTLLELSGLPAPGSIQGQSLLPLLTREDEGSSSSLQRRPAIAEKNLTREAASPWPRDTESFAIVQDRWKLVHNTTRKAGVPEYELYDVEADPFDQRNLAAENPEIVRRLSQALARWRDTALTARLKPDTESMEGLTREQLERLRSLGYIR